ncbi:unnamed protein product [Orchesella dallaii]|uniref:Uncharacterized protein n=1 Tax=Orchesella dallaii TaxID=48710 RepID=A0ABP1PWS9_9HEXA
MQNSNREKGICTLLATQSDCRPANVPGTVTQTRVTHFTFFERIANPCEIAPAPSPINHASASSSLVVSTTTTVSPTEITTTISSVDFYEAMLASLELALGKIQILESADPSLPECNGISLDSLPSTPIMDAMNEADAIQQTYKSGIYLTTHFHLMALDRQMSQSGESNIPDEQLEDDVPTWRFLRCGNETESLPSSLKDVTSQMENILCTMLTSASDEQRASFREPFNKLGKTVLYRYHSSCATLQTRDCLVVREAKQALTLIHRKFSQLMTNANRAGSSNSHDEQEDDMDNSL